MEFRILKFGIFLLVWVIVIVFRLAFLMVPATVNHAPASITAFGSETLLALVIIGAGFIAFGFKKINLLFYGMVEVAFGISSALTLAFSGLPSELHLSQWTSLVGCVYVISRGMSNISDALADPRFSHVGIFLTKSAEKISKMS